MIGLHQSKADPQARDTRKSYPGQRSLRRGPSRLRPPDNVANVTKISPGPRIRQSACGRPSGVDARPGQLPGAARIAWESLTASDRNGRKSVRGVGISLCMFKHLIVCSRIHPLKGTQFDLGTHQRTQSYQAQPDARIILW